MATFPIPSDENARLKKLREYEVLDSLPEEAFERITRLASHLVKTPISLISLVDKNRQWFKSRLGLSVSETERTASFCTHAICQEEVMVVEDATLDDRFASNRLVTGDPEIRFYAGAQLRTKEGISLGTLCVIDNQPRSITSSETQALADLAAVVIDELEMRQLAKRATAAELRLVDAIEALPDGFVYYDKDDRLVLCNQRYREIYANSADLIYPGNSFEYIIRAGVERGQYPEANESPDEWIEERLRIHQNPGDPIEQELPSDQWLRIQERRTREGGLAGFRIDITKLKRQERELKRLAWTDALTNVLNRHRFIELANMERRRAQREGRSVSMILLDVDHFKAINDKFGHAAGDRSLETLARRWKEVLREFDLIGRIGGEEFCILLTHDDSENLISICDRIRTVTSEKPITFKKYNIPVTVSIGIARDRGTPDSLESIMARADAALYEAKRTGRNKYVLSAA